MNTSGIKLLYKTVTCGKPNQNKLVTFVIRDETAICIKALLLECVHHDEHVVEHFNATYKNTEITAKSMNNLKDQLFDMLAIPKSQIGTRFSHTAHWMDVMRMEGATISKLVSKLVPAPVPAEEADVVKKITVDGKLYLKSKNSGVIYDYEEWINNKVVFELGKWNESANKIDFDEQKPEPEVGKWEFDVCAPLPEPAFGKWNFDGQEPVQEPELRRWEYDVPDPVKQTEYFIYIIKGKDFAYVGMTRNFDDRQNKHKRGCNDNLNRNFKGCDAVLPLYTAINNNGGWDAVKMNIVETIETDDIEIAHKYEQYWINKIHIEQPEIAVLNRKNPMKSFVKCSDPFCESKTRRVCSTCNNCSACKKHSVCLSCKDIEAWRKKECAATAAKDEKETNRERARNAYRMKVGIPLDAPLIQRGGAHNVKYHTPEQKAERQEMDREYQKEYQKKYREKKMQDKAMMMEIAEVIDKNMKSPIYMMSFLLESLKNKKLDKSYSDVE